MMILCHDDGDDDIMSWYDDKDNVNNALVWLIMSSVLIW
jgi:hypothetical protein